MRTGFILLAASALAGSLPAHAQTIAGEKPGASPQAVNDNDPQALPEIIVTARRCAEDAQTIPISLSVVGGALLDQSYTVNTQGLTTLIPSLNYSSANPRNTAFTIRGLGSSVVAVSQSNDGLEPGVGFYIDQVYHARPATAAFDFADVAQVEELRGPQGTLFGKNTTAGAINITTRAPSFEPEGFAEISYGERNFVQAKGWVSGPISDTVAFRLSGVSTRRDGVLENIRTGRDANTLGTQAVRGQLLFKPDDRLQTRLIADFTNFQAYCCTQAYLRTGTSLRAATRQFGGPVGLAAQFGYAPPSTNPYDRKIDIDGPLDVDTNEGGVSAISDLNLGFATLTSVTAWRFWNWDAENDRDYTGIPVQLSQHIPSRQDQYSQEIRLASNGDHRLTYVIGLYGFRQRITGRPISIYGPAAARYLIGTTTGTGTGTTAVPANLLDGYGQDGRTDFRTASYAAFGEINYKPVETLTLTGGLRYTHEDKDGYYATTVSGGLATTNTALVNAKLSILRPQAYEAHDRDGSLSGRANIAWAITYGVLGYASYARGFKSGGINMSGLPLDNLNRPVLNTAVVRPERNTTWEAGFKTSAFDRRLIFNIDGYYTEVRDFQATIVDSTQTVALRGYLSNIPQVTVKGIEADATARILPGLTARAALAYADGDYSGYPAGPCPLEVQTAATTACNLTGRRLASLPRLSMTAGLDYVRPIGDGSAFVHVDTASRSGFDGDPSLSRFTYIRGYNLTNANIGYRFSDGVEVALFARNLLDADYIQNLTVQAGNSGLILGTPSDPRTIGLTLWFRR